MNGNVSEIWDNQSTLLNICIATQKRRNIPMPDSTYTYETGGLDLPSDVKSELNSIPLQHPQKDSDLLRLIILDTVKKHGKDVPYQEGQIRDLVLKLGYSLKVCREEMELPEEKTEYFLRKLAKVIYTGREEFVFSQGGPSNRGNSITRDEMFNICLNHTDKSISFVFSHFNSRLLSPDFFISLGLRLDKMKGHEFNVSLITSRYIDNRDSGVKDKLNELLALQQQYQDNLTLRILPMNVYPDIHFMRINSGIKGKVVLLEAMHDLVSSSEYSELICGSTHNGLYKLATSLTKYWQNYPGVEHLSDFSSQLIPFPEYLKNKVRSRCSIRGLLNHEDDNYHTPRAWISNQIAENFDSCWDVEYNPLERKTIRAYYQRILRNPSYFAEKYWRRGTKVVALSPFWEEQEKEGDSKNSIIERLSDVDRMKPFIFILSPYLE